MKFRAIFIIIVAALMSGCPPKDAMLKQRDIQHIDVGLGVDGAQKIISTDKEVDLLSAEVIELLQNQGFKLMYSSVSWGLQPFTGHTQNLSFKLLETDFLHCYVQISKKEFQVKFLELERKPQSNEFATSNSDLAAINRAIASLNELAKKKFNGRSVRVSKFDRAENNNK